MRRAVRSDVGVRQRQLDDAQHLVAAQPRVGLDDLRRIRERRQAAASGGDVTPPRPRDRRSDRRWRRPATRVLVGAAVAAAGSSVRRRGAGALPRTRPSRARANVQRAPHRGTGSRRATSCACHRASTCCSLCFSVARHVCMRREDVGALVGIGCEIVQAPAHAGARGPIEQLPVLGADGAMLGDDDRVLPLGPQDRCRRPRARSVTPVIVGIRQPLVGTEAGPLSMNQSSVS